MRKGLKGKKPVKARKGKGYGILFLFILLAFIFFAIIVGFDKNLFPVALKHLENEMVSRVNTVINECTNDIITDMNLKSEDFYEKIENSDGKLSSMTVNTILINKVCGRAAEDISLKLNELGPQDIKVPLGALSQIQTLSNTGPDYTITMLPMGNAVVDYSSSFEAVGINQINFQVWIKIETKVRVINPLQSTELVISRNIPLVNTIINSDVPNMYISPFKQ